MMEAIALKQLFNNKLISMGIKVAIIAAVVKAIMLAVQMVLPTQGVDNAPYSIQSEYASYKPSRILALDEAASKSVVSKAPVYKLDKLKLKGIFKDQESPFIAVEENKKVVLISKDESFKGYKLIEIYSDRVTFEKSGKNYELRFKEQKNSQKNSITTAESEIIHSDNAVFVKRTEIKYYAKNYDEIWRKIKIKEIIKDRKLQGFKVESVKRGSVFEKIGLKSGDIITGANNQKFKSISQVFKLYNNIDKMDSMKLTIIRDNKIKELEYEIF